MVVIIAVAALVAPVLPLNDPEKQDFAAPSMSPSSEHPLGTDRLRRDTLSRLIHGARTSLAVGVLAQIIVLGIGVPIGIIASFSGSGVDNLLMRGVDIVYAFPDLLLIILIRAVFGGNLYMMILAIGLGSWPTIARLMRGQALSIKEREFVLAARSTGAGSGRIIVRHVLPNAVGPVVVASAFLIPRAIFAEAALSYIGIGVSPTTPSWGAMVNEGYKVIFAAHEQVLFPAVAIGILTMSFTFLGDGLRNLLDPRSTYR